MKWFTIFVRICYRSISPMPSSNRDRNIRVLYAQFIDTNPASFEYVPNFKYLLMWMKHMLLTYGTCDEVVVVVNATGLSWRHIIKLPISLCTKLLKFLEVSRNGSIVFGRTYLDIIIEVITWYLFCRNIRNCIFKAT